MYDKGKILTGLVLFVAIVAFPFWWSLASGAEVRVPDIAKPAGETQCLEDAETMRREHMQLLATWRDDVVRLRQRIHTTPDGRQYRKSLTGTCLQCHTDKAASCDRCHDYLDVAPYCWDCHVATGER
ncbi:MAG: sulfate reduction electron transfer complex DsrMKJOP subunit DsrJ [Vicinamibacteraceae bacterium]|nr:sulfate reduction electron transfer complex DsrMKJOP subunit DsrJ [Vicinamibacteraceae bacterium]